MTPLTGTVRLSFALFALVTACDPDDTNVDASCEAVADHVEQLCGPVVGAMFAANIRQIQCAVEDGVTLSQSERDCALAADSCEELEESDCAPGEVSIACDDAADCAAPLQCDVEREECVRCSADAECASDERCVEDLCFAADSQVVVGAID